MTQEFFTYDADDYVFSVSRKVVENSKVNLSRFDQLLRTKWDEAMSKGCFRYNLEHVQTQVVPGKHKFVLQLNSRRLQERRPPENIVSLQTPYNPERFNFMRVKPEEILFYLKPKLSSVANGFSESCELEDGVAHSLNEKKQCHLVLINVSPLEYGHVLLIPDADCGIPQRLTSTGICLALDLLLLSAHPGFRIGFNSLCALASVNHQHIHGWYLEYPLSLEDAPVRKICDNFYELVDFPACGFAFELHGSSNEGFCKVLFTVANFLQTNSIAHNFFMTRGSKFNSSPEDKDSTVRAFFWPRKSFTGAKSCTLYDEDVPFNIAVAELAGHVPMYVPEKYDKLTEDYISEKLSEVLLPDVEYEAIRDKIRDCILSV